MPQTNTIPVARVIGKLDEYLNRDDYEAAARHLNYWLAEAEAAGDQRGRLAVLNEQIGLYRKTERETEGLCAAEAALETARTLGMEHTITMGTTLLNAATAYKAFGRPGAALPLYRQAQEIYEASLPPEDPRRAGLYNNMALTVMELGDYGEARELFEKALAILSTQSVGAAETAITYCNLADLAAAEKGMVEGEAQITDALERAGTYLDLPNVPRDGYYAYVCEKCAPTFGWYGWFAYEKELTERAAKLRERI